MATALMSSSASLSLLARPNVGGGVAARTPVRTHNRMACGKQCNNVGLGDPRHAAVGGRRRVRSRAFTPTGSFELWTPDQRAADNLPLSDETLNALGAYTPPSASYSPASATPGTSYSEHKPRTPPPDLPSLLLDSRIVYIGMPLVPAVTELIVSELLYMQYTDPLKPCYIYINSTGCQRADGEVVGFETEATSIYDTMKYIGNPIFTVGTGVAIGQACMILSAGDKGKRFMTTHATAMLHQPKVPSTGQRQAIEVHIKWKEVLEQKKSLLEILSETTGHSKEKIDKDIQRPLYMTADDAIAYGIVDKKVDKNAQTIDKVLNTDQWDSAAGLVKSSRPAPPGGNAAR